jgi:hypothetical protein
MRNVTITMSEEVARWARVEAAKRGTSVSRMVGEMLRERMERELDYQRALADFESVAPRPLRETGRELPKREALHDRPGLR